MTESLSFQEMTTRLTAREDIINNQHRKRFGSYIENLLSEPGLQPRL